MHLFTFVLDFDGGTYISQVSALSEKDACINWAESIACSEIDGFNENTKLKLINEMKSENPVLLKELTNCWCISVLLNGKLALINLIKTETANNEQTPANN